MPNDRGNRKQDPPGRESRLESETSARIEGSGRLAPLPELMRRALSMGLSGFFLTEEAVRKALGDTLPKDWIDFAVDQSERTRKEFLERLTFEMGRSLENVDVASALRDLLEGRTLEIRAEVRLRDPDEDETDPQEPGTRRRR
jgi:hypothetical protein